MIGSGNPVKEGDVETTLQPLNLSIRLEDAADYQPLLAAVHDCAEHVNQLADYQPLADREPSRAKTFAYQILISKTLAMQGETSSKTSNLNGKIVCIKDCIAVADVPQSFGSDAFPAWIPRIDATVVSRLLDAGANIGIVENPHAAGYSSGGSTSGGAALVAGGVVDIALGTDQGGSIRVPASLSGCVGFKPTHGLVSFTGISSGDPVDDHAGPIARSVDDVAACLDAVAGYDGIDDRSLGAGRPGSFDFQASLTRARLDGICVGVLEEGYTSEHVQSGVRNVFLQSVDRLRALGAHVESVSIPLHVEGPSIWTIQQRISGAAGILGHSSGRRGLYLTDFERARLPWTAPNVQKLFPSTQNTVVNGLYLQSRFPGLYGKAMNVGRQIRDAYETCFERFDVVVMPTTPFVAPRHGSRDSVLECLKPSIGMTLNTAVFNITGHPALSLPVGWSAAVDDKAVLLPVGLQVVGALWQDKKVLQVAKALESSFVWQDNKAD
ncbi:hypothetical protein D0859_04688 [Hortaea werneckii]|uniref:Amidase domain-containing protein n=1 Tax=Hortaea werneckii TaxID=91943 RepID=A0A3M7J0J5_HORWE|nr:hypothetical protein D0859_04688 [Hortaea werneckii]